MIKHLLVPLDGSHLAESALPAAVFLAQQLGASVTLIHIIEKNAPEEIHGEQHLTQTAQANEYLSQTAAKYFKGLAEVNTHTHSEEISDIPGSIVAHSGELTPDLIIMCSHGHGGVRDWMVGSIAQQVIGRGETPILLIHPSTDQPATTFTLQRILVALDSDPEHEQGLKLAVELAKLLPACELNLMSVVPTFNTLKGEQAAAGRLLPAATRAMLEATVDCYGEYLDGLAAPLRRQGLTVTTSVQRGDPASAIAQAGQNSKADLIVLGTHGRAGWQAFWAGSVAAKVITQAHQPLLLAPAHKANLSNA